MWRQFNREKRDNRLHLSAVEDLPLFYHHFSFNFSRQCKIVEQFNDLYGYMNADCLLIYQNQNNNNNKKQQQPEYVWENYKTTTNLIALHSEAKSELWHYFKLITSGEIHHCLLTHTYSSIDLQNLYIFSYILYKKTVSLSCLMSVMGIKTKHQLNTKKKLWSYRIFYWCVIFIVLSCCYFFSHQKNFIKTIINKNNSIKQKKSLLKKKT